MQKDGLFEAWSWMVNCAIIHAARPRITTGRIEIAIDTHVHTLFSRCSVSQPEQVIRHAVKLGLGAIAVMDHNDINGALSTMRCAEILKRKKEIPETFLVIPGVEVGSTKGHIGALFVQENMPNRATPDTTVKAIHEAGGLAVAVHPCHTSGVGCAIFDAPFDAVEADSGSILAHGLARVNANFCRDPRLDNITKLGASDAHYVSAIGNCYTVIPMLEPTLESARRSIANGWTSARSSKACSRVRKLLGVIPSLNESSSIICGSVAHF